MLSLKNMSREQKEKPHVGTDTRQKGGSWIYSKILSEYRAFWSTFSVHTSVHLSCFLVMNELALWFL